jgi:tyrosyl-tRNA synthetase
MELEKRLQLIREVGEEILTEPELRELLEKKKKIVAYDGFEPSGQVHIAQGLLRAINVNKMVKAGCSFKMLVADWHAWANSKLGGSLERIHAAGEYMVEVWKACSMELGKVEFVWANELVGEREYWEKAMRVATNSTVRRIVRCCQIMGRKESEALKASQIFYPCMQAADIFHLEADIAQLGMDQRKVNVLARELGEKIGYWKPVAVHHHMLMGLQAPKCSASGKDRGIELKMSKSIPDSAIFMTDPEKEIERKINKAYCPPGNVAENPVLEYCKYLVFEKFGEMRIERAKRFGGDITFSSFGELSKAFAERSLHPADLKKATAFYLNKMIEPVRKHFEGGRAKGLLEKVRSLKVSR